MEKLQKYFEEFTVFMVPFLIGIVVVGVLWAIADSATADPFKDFFNTLLGTGGVIGFFTNLPSDGLKVLLVGSIVTAAFGFAIIIAITAKDGRRFWYKLLFRKEPPI